MTVTPEELNAPAAPDGGDQLAWERRLGPRVGQAAALAAIFIIASFVSQLPILRDKSKNEAGYLTSVHKHASAYVLSGLFTALALLLVSVVLWYLFRAVKYRRPQTPNIGLILGVAGPILFALVQVAGPFVIRHYAAEFVNGSNHTKKHAEDLVKTGSAQILNILTPIAALTFVFAMVMNNVNAIRTGLLNTFAGVIGVIAGVLFLVPIGPPQLLTFFWLASLALIFMNRWPGGRGPAWASGTMLKWPSAMERRGMAAGAPARGRPQRPGRGAQPPPDEERTIAADESVPESSATRSSRKRKRKRGRKH